MNECVTALWPQTPELSPCLGAKWTEGDSLTEAERDSAFEKEGPRAALPVPDVSRELPVLVRSLPAGQREGLQQSQNLRMSPQELHVLCAHLSRRGTGVREMGTRSGHMLVGSRSPPPRLPRQASGHVL